MTDTNNPARASEADPAQFKTEDGFWLEIVVRNRDGSHEVQLTELEGVVYGTLGPRLTKDDLALALTQAMKATIEVLGEEW